MTTPVENNPAAAADAQHAALGMKASPANTHTTHPEAQWFPRAGLGLFIHWGIASVHGGIDLSWGMIANTPWDAAAQGKNKITPEDYWALAPRFQPDRYNPDLWLKAAADAGFQYAVLTTQHHDGYTLWPSRYSSLGVQTHLAGRDLVRPYVEACRRHGLKVGLYYSPPDWLFDRDYKSFNYGTENPARFPGRPHFNTHHQPCTLPP
ncbi:MAG: glycoside hydrolase, partial [Phycisphaerae bacterium]|nr:glycoside hydrolase [Phycisphaerae bacterium]